jgi:hypothetical protein
MAQSYSDKNSQFVPESTSKLISKINPYIY